MAVIKRVSKAQKIKTTFNKLQSTKSELGRLLTSARLTKRKNDAILKKINKLEDKIARLY